MDAAHDLVLGRRFEAGRPVVDGDRREPELSGGGCATAVHEIGEVERDRPGLSRQKASRPTETWARLAPAPYIVLTKCDSTYRIDVWRFNAAALKR